MTCYFITGGTGLIGNYVVRELVDRGVEKNDIVVYDLYPNENSIDDIHEEVTLVRGDVTDEIQLMETFRAYQPDKVIHLAAYVAHKSWENPSEAIRVNCTGTNNVFDISYMFDVDICLFASSASVYGSVDDYYWKDEPVTVQETDPVKPQNPYAVTKYLSEVMGRTYDEKYDLNYVSVRIGGGWGIGRVKGATGQLNTFVRDAGLGEDVTVPPFWTLWDRVNLSYGKELGRWFVDVVGMNQFSHAVYNQGNKMAYEVEEIVDTLERLQPEISIAYPDPDETEEWSDDLVNPELDVSRWYDDLGLTQEWSVEDAVVDYVNYYRRRKGLKELSL